MCPSPFAGGKILGFAGLVGAGRTEVARAVFGADPRTAGEIQVHGQVRPIRTPTDAIRVGSCLSPEDRKGQDLHLHMSIRDNIFFSVTADNFFSMGNLLGVGRQVATTGIAAVGMTILLLVGGIDISVGTMCAFTGVVCTKLVVWRPSFFGYGDWFAYQGAGDYPRPEGVLALTGGYGCDVYLEAAGSWKKIRQNMALLPSLWYNGPGKARLHCVQPFYSRPLGEIENFAFP